MYNFWRRLYDADKRIDKGDVVDLDAWWNIKTDETKFVPVGEDVVLGC